MAQESRLVIVIDSKNAERNARNLGNELDSIERKGDFATKSMDGLSVATRQLAGYMAGLVTVSAAISKMDTYTNLSNKLKLVTSSQGELNKAMEDTFKIAQKARSEWGAVNDVYTKYMSNAKTLNLTQEQVAKLTETTSKAVALSGSTSESAAAALFQYGQALDGNILRAEEYNSLVDGAGGLLNAIAKGLGVTRGELRQMMLDGKLTGEVVTQALLKVGDSVSELHEKTNATIGGSFTQLSNAVTKFVGESSQTSGAANAISSALSGLAENLETVTNIAMVGGAYLAGTYIPTIYASSIAVAAKTKELAAQTVTQYAAIQAERAAAAQQVINTQVVVTNTQATLAAIAAEKALEVQRLKSQITEKGRTATLTRMAELKKIEAQVTRELAVAEGALASAQARSAAAGAASVGIGSRLLGLLGGPVGIGITVASLAAGYLLMRDNGDKANDMLEKQSRYAGMAADELMKLEGAQKRAAEGELAKQLSLQNAQLSKSQNEFLLLTQSITDNNKQSAEAYRIWAELKTGVIDVNQAFNRLNQLSFISSDQINQLADSKKKVDENSKAVKQTNSELNQVRASGANAKAGFNDVSQGAKGAVQDVTELNKKLKDINKSLADRKWDADFKALLIGKYGKSAEEAELLLETYRENQKKGVTGITEGQKLVIKGIVDQENALESLVNKDKERTKELEKQQKVLSTNAKVQANAAKYGFAGIESKYNLPAGTLSAIHAIETGNSGRTDQVNKSTGATGGFQFLEGTAKQYGVKDRTNLAQSAEGAGKYMSYLLKLFKGDLEKAVRAYHAGEGNVQKGKGIGKYNNQYWKDFQGYVAGSNGYASGDISSKDFDKLLQDATKMADDQAKLRLQLENDVANEVTKIRNDLAKKLEDVDKANFTPEREAKIRAELQARADNDVAIAQQALRTKLDDYRQFNMTEEQLLKESFNRKKFNAAHDIELSKTQRDEAIKYLNEQEQQELALIKLAQEQRLFQSRLFLMSETDAIRERYRLERKEIERTVKDEIELRKRLALSKDQEQLELITRAAQATKNWQSTYSELTGNSQMFQLDQTRQDRTGQSLALADSQNADVMARAQDPNADLEALAAEQEAIWQAHRDRMALIDQDYWGKTKAYQLGMAADVFGGLSGVMLNFVDECSSSYRMLIAAQKGANLASVFMSNLTAISAAWSSAPFPANLPAVALTTAKTGVLQATLQAFTPQGFATGGQIRGPGTTTSDSIPIMASDKEFMFKASSAASIGLENLNYMNKTGELPPNHDAAQLSAIQRQQRQSDLINTSINQRNAGSTQSAAPTVVDNQMVVNNFIDPREIPQAMANPYGAKVFMNFIKLHKSTIRGMLGVPS